MSGDKPNILLLIAHDLGTHLGCYGVPGVPSPRLDQFANTGTKFTQHYCSAAFCSPCRGALFTGKYPHVNGLMGLVNLGWDLQEGQLTLGQALHGHGYETYLFGLEHEVADANRLNHMFDYVSDRSLGHGCEKVAPLVCDFLRDRDSDQPFYARVGFAEVHRFYERYEPDDPDHIFVPPYLTDTSGTREDLAMFHGAVACLDKAVGEILDALEVSGQMDNTWVIVTTDHGIAFPRAKATLYDPGIHTTMLMRWPAVLPEGYTHDALLSSVDLMPTVLDAVGAPIPNDLQGLSYWPLLHGQDGVQREWIFAEKNTSPDDIKRGIRTQQYKYIRNLSDGPLLKLPTDIEGSLTRRDMGDAHLASRPSVELYDLVNDPLEVHNLAGQDGLAGVEWALNETLEAILTQTHDPILRGPIRRPPDEEAMIQRSLDRVLKRVAERDGT